MNQNIEERWSKLIAVLEVNFGKGLDLWSVLFFVGLQELGKTPEKCTKEEKTEIIKVGVGSVFCAEGRLEETGRDDEGWPTWTPVGNEELPSDDAVQLKKAALSYFVKNGVID